MKYSNEYLACKDIDWFCILNGYNVHIASAGGLIPEEVNDREKLRSLQHSVYNAADIFADEDIINNESFLTRRFGNDQIRKNLYLESFRAMSRKGFISLDRTKLDDIEDNTYHIVCMPRNPVRIVPIADLPKLSLDNLRIEEPKEEIDLQSLMD